MDFESMDFMNAENNQLRNECRLLYRGVAIIAIFKKFKQESLDIAFADEDRKLLEDGFSKLQYGVVVWDDIMSKNVFFQRLKHVSSSKLHSDCETFALVIITHGDENGKLFAYDTHFNRQDVYQIFNAKNCLGLKGKPQLFVFHACRGLKFGEGVQASGKMPGPSKPVAKLGDVIEKNHVVLCSTFEGKVAMAPGKKGSYFIDVLRCLMLEEAGKNENDRKHILAFLTDVINKTATKDFGGDLMIKQQPVLMMALHRLYYFKDKEVISDETLYPLTTASLGEAIKH